jgi:RNA polymerase sigma-70 factor (ECF subfamily)
MLTNPSGWLFRIAHRVVLDHHRRRARIATSLTEDMPDMIDEGGSVHQRFAAAAALGTFMQLPVSQRSCIILMDVLGHSLKEVACELDLTVLAVKAALHRGRARLRELSTQVETATPALTATERALLRTYVERFNARDFDGVRAMLSEEVRLDLVARTTMKGRAEVSTYFSNYAGKDDWVLAAGCIEGRPAVLVSDRTDPSGQPRYIVILEWRDHALTSIRDFRYAHYTLDGVVIARV